MCPFKILPPPLHLKIIATPLHGIHLDKALQPVELSYLQEMTIRQAQSNIWKTHFMKVMRALSISV